MNKRDPKVFDVFRLDVITGDMQLVAENPGNITSWHVDHAGRVRAATTSDGVNTSLLYREDECATFKTVLTTNFREQMAPCFFTFDNKALYSLSNIGRDKSAIVILDPRTGKELSIVAENNKVDMDGLSFSRKRKAITYAKFTTEKDQWQFFDCEAESLYQKLQAKLPGYEIASLDNCDRAEETFIVHAYNDRTKGADYLYEKVHGRLTKLSERAPWLSERDLTEMKPISYTSRDKLVIHGYLTLPKGLAPKNLPVVIHPHGGPWHRDSWGYNSEVQFLANRGYAVLQMNFRGSTGYGRMFWEASFKQWGLAMQDDITDGVQWLIAQGIADPRRIGIYGGSYGGYATLAGVAFTPDLYAAAVDYVGVSNMFTFMQTMPPYWEPSRQMLYEMVGNPEKDKELFARVSPVLHADQIKTPLFIAQGANDPRVNKNESDQVVGALQKRGVPVEYMLKSDEGHGFHNEENRFDFYEAMEMFLEKYLKDNIVITPHVSM